MEGSKLQFTSSYQTSVYNSWIWKGCVNGHGSWHCSTGSYIAQALVHVDDRSKGQNDACLETFDLIRLFLVYVPCNASAEIPCGLSLATQCHL